MADAANQKIDLIQSLRGIAALSVVICHSHVHGAEAIAASSSPNWTAFFQWLHAVTPSGVDLFFMISGFIMVYTTRDADGSMRAIRRFLAHRTARIWPLYAALTLAAIPLALYQGRIFGTVDVLKSLAFIPLHFGAAATPPFWGEPVLHVGWTLNFEVYFYLVVALSLFFGRRSPLFIYGWMIATLIAIPAIKFGYVGFAANTRYPINGYWNLVTSPLIWDFVIGVATAQVYLSKFRIASTEACWLLLSVAIAFGAWIAWGFPPGYGDFGLGHWGLAWGVIFFTLMLTSKTLALRQPRALVYLGKISYSLYLVHPFVVHPLWMWPRDHLPGLRPALTDFPYGVLVIVLSVVAGAAAYNYLETPLSAAFRALLARRGRDDGKALVSAPGGG